MPITPFKAFKLCLGLFFSISWLSLLPFAENFKGVYDISLNPNWYWSFIFNNQLEHIVILSLSLSGVGLIFNQTTRISSFWLLINWILIYQFMPFIFFPPNGTFIGWILLWLLFYPNSLNNEQRLGWYFVITLGYFCSGIAKLGSELWVNGEAVHYLLNGALTREPFRWFINLDNFNKVITYMILGLEIFGILLIWKKFTRQLLWVGFLIMHLTISISLNIPEIGLFFLILNLALIEDKSLNSLEK